MFGYASVPLDDFGPDIQALVNENDWTIIHGSLIVGILNEKSKPDLEFGNRPDNKTLRKMAKEQKNAQASEL